MAFSAVMFALMGFFAHVASAHAHWTVVAATRAAVGAAVAYGVARARAAPLLVKNRRGIWLRSVFGTASLLCTFFALGSPLGLADVTTLINLTPVLIAVLGPRMLGERGGRRVIVALALCVVGVVLILHPAFLFGGGVPRTRDAWIGAAAAVAATLFSANAMILLRRISPTEGAEAIALHFSLVAAGTTLLLALPHLSVPGLGAGAAMLVAGLSAGVAQLAMTRAYALERAARVSGVGYLAVVVSAILGAAVLGEKPGVAAMMGMGLVVAGGLVVSVAGWRGGARAG